jgi:hypothetical protein
MVVTLGALLADTPHTRPIPVSGTTTERELADRLKLEQSNYEGPTGIVGVFQDACMRNDMPAVSFWAAVPHYVAQPPCPKATLALLGWIEDVLDLTRVRVEIESTLTRSRRTPPVYHAPSESNGDQFEGAMKWSRTNSSRNNLADVPGRGSCTTADVDPLTMACPWSSRDPAVPIDRTGEVEPTLPSAERCHVRGPRPVRDRWIESPVDQVRCLRHRLPCVWCASGCRDASLKGVLVPQPLHRAPCHLHTVATRPPWASPGTSSSSPGTRTGIVAASSVALS